MSETGRLLIVDDESPVREVLTEYFVSRGYEVVGAADGPEALAVFARERPDVVLLDMRMPRMDGMEVLKRLRQVDPDVAVIMVTANDDVDLARETLSVGAFDYVAKPFDFEHLHQTVATALVHSARSPLARAAPPAPVVPVWGRLAVDVFRVVRAMSPEARSSTGARLERAALAAAGLALSGGIDLVSPQLVELGLLVAVASELGDLSAGARATLEAALSAARAALPAR